MTIFYRNLIVGFFWALMAFLVIQSNTSQMLLAMLFTVFVLHFTEDHVAGWISSGTRKAITLSLAVIAISFISYGLYMAFSVMFSDFNKLIESSQDVIVSTLAQHGIEVAGITEVYDMVFDFLKQNTEFLTFSATLVLKSLLGVVLGIILYFSPITENSNNAWGSVMSTVSKQASVFYESFKNIMAIQAMIAVMNTVIITVLATGFTWLWFGEFLPYWYVLVALTAILSLVPVVGNLLINLILALLTVQMSPLYVLVGLVTFVGIHKLELLVIGKKMDEKVNIQFAIILFSMVLGEMLFHSMSGMILGMVTIVTIATLLRQVSIENGVSTKAKQD